MCSKKRIIWIKRSCAFFMALSIACCCSAGSCLDRLSFSASKIALTSCSVMPYCCANDLTTPFSALCCRFSSAESSELAMSSGLIDCACVFCLRHNGHKGSIYADDLWLDHEPTREEALADLRAGKIILVTDDPDRENEGDFICAAQFATTENVNFMAKHAKGLICTPMSQAVADRLGLEQMVKVNTDIESAQHFYANYRLVMTAHLSGDGVDDTPVNASGSVAGYNNSDYVTYTLTRVNMKGINHS